MVDHEPCIDLSLYIIDLNSSAYAQTYNQMQIHLYKRAWHNLTQPKDPEIKVAFFPPKYVIPKSLKVSHWLSEQPKSEHNSKEPTVPTAPLPFKEPGE